MYSRWVSPHSVLGTERSLLSAVYLKGKRGRGKGRGGRGMEGREREVGEERGRGKGRSRGGEEEGEYTVSGGGTVSK